MKETSDLYSAVKSSVMDLERCGTSFAPDMDALTRELMTSKHRGGLIISPADNQNGFEVAEYAASEEDIKDSGVTVDDLWECTKEHYGLTAVTGLFSTVAIPIEKVKLGHRVPTPVQANIQI